ncbi:hypothetical protein ACA910_007554 [Epithemia clementina (nom. ined.)]
MRSKSSTSATASGSASSALLSILLLEELPLSQTEILKPDEVTDSLEILFRLESRYRCGDYLTHNRHRPCLGGREDDGEDEGVELKLSVPLTKSTATATMDISSTSRSSNSSSSATRSSSHSSFTSVHAARRRGRGAASSTSASSSTSTLIAVKESPVDASCREKMCDWSYRVCQHFAIPRNIVAVAFSLLDRYVDQRWSWVDRRTYKLASMTTLYLATKLFNSRPLAVTTLADLSRGEFTDAQLLAMEQEIMVTLQWQLHAPAVLDFVQYLFTFLPSSLHPNQSLRFTQKAVYWAELVVYDYDLILHDKSILALAAIFNALEDVLGGEGEEEQQSLVVELEWLLLDVVQSFQYPMAGRGVHGGGVDAAAAQVYQRKLGALVQRTQRRLWYLFTCSAQYELEQQQQQATQQQRGRSLYRTPEDKRSTTTSSSRKYRRRFSERHRPSQPHDDDDEDDDLVNRENQNRDNSFSTVHENDEEGDPSSLERVKLYSPTSVLQEEQQQQQEPQKSNHVDSSSSSSLVSSLKATAAGVVSPAALLLQRRRSHHHSHQYGSNQK